MSALTSCSENISLAMQAIYSIAAVFPGDKWVLNIRHEGNWIVVNLLSLKGNHLVKCFSFKVEPTYFELHDTETYRKLYSIDDFKYVCHKVLSDRYQWDN